MQSISKQFLIFIYLVCFLYEQKSGVILTSTEPNIFRMLFSIKNYKNHDVGSLLGQWDKQLVDQAPDAQSIFSS